MATRTSWKNWFVDWVTRNSRGMTTPDNQYNERRIVKLVGIQVISDDYDLDATYNPGGTTVYFNFHAVAGWNDTGTFSLGSFTPDGSPAMVIDFGAYATSVAPNYPATGTFDRIVFVGTTNNQMDYPQWYYTLDTPVVVTDWSTITDKITVPLGDLEFGPFTGDGAEISDAVDDMFQYFFKNSAAPDPIHPLFPFPSGHDSVLTVDERIDATDRYVDLLDTAGDVIVGTYYRPFPIYKENYINNNYMIRERLWGFTTDASSGLKTSDEKIWWKLPACTVRYWSIRSGDLEILRGQFDSDLVCSDGDVIAIDPAQFELEFLDG